MEKWEHGMDMRALNYCVDELNGTYVSMQVLIGQKDTNSENLIKLRKHGGSEGVCHRWDIAADDWVSHIEYSFDFFSGNAQRIRLFTNKGEQRIIG